MAWRQYSAKIRIAWNNPLSATLVGALVVVVVMLIKAFAKMGLEEVWSTKQGRLSLYNRAT